MQEKIFNSEFVSKKDLEYLKNRVNLNKAKENKKWSQPWVMAQAECQLETVDLKFSDDNKFISLERSDFGIMVVLIDFVVVLIYIWFIFFLERK